MQLIKFLSAFYLIMNTMNVYGMNNPNMSSKGNGSGFGSPMTESITISSAAMSPIMSTSRIAKIPTNLTEETLAELAKHNAVAKHLDLNKQDFSDTESLSSSSSSSCHENNVLFHENDNAIEDEESDSASSDASDCELPSIKRIRINMEANFEHLRDILKQQKTGHSIF